MQATRGALAAEWQAARTVSLFFQHLDQRDYAQAAALFAEDGTWQRLGQCLTGPAAIQAALQTRPKLLATRHLVTNMASTADEHGVAAKYYVIVFEDEQAGTAPGKLTAPGAIFASDDRLIETETGWRFASRRPSLVFKRPADGN